MHFLYGSKKRVDRRLVATFGSEPQLLAYVSWATLKSLGERRRQIRARQHVGELRGLGTFYGAANR